MRRKPERNQPQVKGGRPPTGSIEWADAAKTVPVGVRVTQANGKRKFVRFEPGTTAEDARTLAPVLAERARFAVGEHEGETVAEYSERWLGWRKERGIGAGDGTTLALHVLPHIGNLPIGNVARDDLKRLVYALDAKAHVGSYSTPDGKRQRFGYKSAVCAWSVTRALFRDAQQAKRLDLCVRDDNPAAGVAGPDTGARKAKAYLWPSEVLTLVSDTRVPIRWRRLFALAVYTFARAGELAALEWSDIDLDHLTIHIHRSTDRTRGRSTTTKTDAARRIPIEPALALLLSAMHREAKGRGAVFRMPSTGKQSAKLRAFLARVGVTRADLFTSDATRKAITFHDLRATGITWCAMRGDDPLKILQRAGHAAFETTRIYLREAENLSAGFGNVFPALPPDLFTRPARARGVSASVSAFGFSELHIPGKNPALSVGATGFEPATP